MPNDSIGNWVEKAKSSETSKMQTSGIKVIRREEPKTKGQIILMIADRMFPRLMAFFKDKRDESGMLLQPAHVRGIALNLAEVLVKNRELKEKNGS